MIVLESLRPKQADSRDFHNLWFDGADPAAVGVGEDWSHLNKQRQRARKMKVERASRGMLEVNKIQRKAALHTALVVVKAQKATGHREWSFPSPEFSAYCMFGLSNIT